MRNRCDKLLSPIIINLHPKCLLCNAPTQVAHHFIKKSTSTRLRYQIDNLIPLCHRDHQALHSGNESLYSGRIIAIKGIEWFNILEDMKNEIVKADVHFYIQTYKDLQEIYDLSHDPL